MGRTVTNSLEIKERLILQYKAVNRKRVEACQPKLTYKTLAAACNISESAVNKWFGKKDRVAPNIENLIVLAPLLECDVDYLLGIQDTPNREVFNICASTGLSEKAVESLVFCHMLAKKENVTEEESEYVEYHNMLLSIISSLILSDVPSCILPAILVDKDGGEIKHYRSKKTEYLSDEDALAIQKLRAQESLLTFINQQRQDRGLDPLK